VPTAPPRRVLAIALVTGALTLPCAGLAQSLGGAPSRVVEPAPYSPRRGADPYAAQHPPDRRPGLFERLFGWSGQRPRRNYEYAPYGWGPNDSYANTGGGYRTLCVRLCDGYYWPMNFSTTGGGVRSDAVRCENSCNSETRLFYQRSPGSDPNYMVDLSGARYADLPNAFRYRSEYVEDCRCKPQPWSAEAKTDYETRAEQQQAEADEAVVRAAERAKLAAAEQGDAAAAGAPDNPLATARQWQRRPTAPPPRRPGWERRGIFSAWW